MIDGSPSILVSPISRLADLKKRGLLRKFNNAEKKMDFFADNILLAYFGSIPVAIDLKVVNKSHL